MGSARLALLPFALWATTCKATIGEPSPQDRIDLRKEAPDITFAVIGDYGLASADAGDVARLVSSWDPAFILTLGDNNYPSGQASTIDDNIGQYYHSFIAPYTGRYGEGASENRFFPTLGNHDWRTRNIAPYLDYFSLPGNERFYRFVWGPVEFFAIDSDPHEPQGNTATSPQADWLKQALADSESPWQVVYMHHAPYSSGDHGSYRPMQWPFHAWGADVVMSGHDHHYERLMRDEGPYVVNGLGGNPHRYGIGRALASSTLRFNAAHGAMRVTADPHTMRLQFVTVEGKVIDDWTLP